MTPRDQVLLLEREFADAMQRMYVVGNGLARMRADLEQQGAPGPLPTTAGSAPRPPLPHPAGATTRVGAAPVLHRGPQGSSPSAAVPPSALEPREPWYRREGAVTRVLAVAGAVVTVSGIAMLLVLAVRQGWFGPAARVASGAALAGLLGGLGARGGARDRAQGRVVGSAPVALVATGAASAYLDVVAVTALYGWVPPTVGLLLCVGVAVAGLWLARQWASELLAALTIAGAAFFSPFVAGRPGWLVCAILAVLSAVGWWAAAGRPTPRLTIVRTVPVGLALVTSAVSGTSGDLRLLLVAAAVLLGTLSTSALTLRRHPGEIAESVALGVAVIGTLAVAAAESGTTRTLAYALTAAVLLLASAAAGRAPLGPLPAPFVGTLAAGGAVASVLAVLAGAPDSFAGTGLLLLALGHVAVAGTTRSRMSLATGAAVAAVALATWVPHPVAMLTVAMAERHDLPVAFIDSALVGALVGLLSWAVATVRGVTDHGRRAVRIAALGVGLVAGATMIVSVGTLAGTRLGDTALGFITGHAVSTVAWMAVAAALLLQSLERRDSDLAVRLGLGLAAVAVAKLFLFDLASLDGLVRSLAFIVTGLLLLATGSRYARSWERRRRSA